MGLVPSLRKILNAVSVLLRAPNLSVTFKVAVERDPCFFYSAVDLALANGYCSDLLPVAHLLTNCSQTGMIPLIFMAV